MLKHLIPFSGPAIVLLLTLLLTSCIPTREVGSVGYPKRYAASYQPGEVEIKAGYQYTYTQLGDRYILRRFFPETETVTNYTEYADGKFTVKDGRHESFYDDGAPRSQGAYQENEQTGRWKYYSYGGLLSKEGDYVAGKHTGEWTSYHDNGRISRVENYVANELDGIVSTYDTAGVLETKRRYQAGEDVETLLDLKPTPESLEAMKQPEKMPRFPGCSTSLAEDEFNKCSDKKMLEFIYSNVRYPTTARNYGVQGLGIVQFVVDKDGSIGDILVIDGLSRDISAELVRIVSLMPIWQPGEQGGKKVRVQFNLPVRFKLE